MAIFIASRAVVDELEVGSNHRISLCEVIKKVAQNEGLVFAAKTRSFAMFCVKI